MWWSCYDDDGDDDDNDDDKDDDHSVAVAADGRRDDYDDKGHNQRTTQLRSPLAASALRWQHNRPEARSTWVDQSCRRPDLGLSWVPGASGSGRPMEGSGGPPVGPRTSPGPGRKT